MDDDATNEVLFYFFSNSPPNFLSLESLKSECGKKKKVPLSMIIQQKKSLPIFHVCVERTDTHKSLTHLHHSIERERETPVEVLR